MAEDSNLLIGVYCHWSGVQIEYLDDTASLFHGADRVCSVETLLFHEADSRLQNTLTPLLLGVRNWNMHLAVPWNYSICRKRNMAHRLKFRELVGLAHNLFSCSHQSPFSHIDHTVMYRSLHPEDILELIPWQ